MLCPLFFFSLLRDLFLAFHHFHAGISCPPAPPAVNKRPPEEGVKE